MSDYKHDSVPLWNKMPDEPARWFARFDLYRSLGPNRTIARTYQITAQTEGLSTKRPGREWYAAAKKWRWKARAEAWDAHERDRLRAIEDDRRFDAREARLAMIDRLLNAVFNVLGVANLDNLDEETARTWLPTMRMLFKDLIQAQRQELGLPASAETQARDGAQHPEGSRPPGKVPPFTAEDLAAAQQAVDEWQARSTIHYAPLLEKRGVHNVPLLEQRGVHTGGGAYIEGNVSVDHGNFMGRDKTVSNQVINDAHLSPPTPRGFPKTGISAANEQMNSINESDTYLLLRSILAGLYPDKGAAQRIAEEARLDLASIPFSHLPINNWHAILQSATDQGRLTDLLNLVQAEYGDNIALRKALQSIEQMRMKEVNRP